MRSKKKLVALLGSALLVVGCSGEQEPSAMQNSADSEAIAAADAAAKTAQAAVDEAAKAARAAAAAAAEEARSPWIYSHDADEMGKGVTHFAMLESTNTVNFDFPYSGEQHGRLVLRLHPRHGKDVMLSVDKGQFNCRFDGCAVLVRFDDGEARKFTAVEPADNDSTVLFIEGFSRFYSSLKKAKRVRIEAEFYSEGLRTFDFDVSKYSEREHTHIVPSA